MALRRSPRPPRPRGGNPDQAPWAGQWVYRVCTPADRRHWGLHPRGRRRYALIRGWPTPVSERVRTLMPPLPGRPVYGLEARRWATAQLDRNHRRQQQKHPKAARRWLGAYTLRWLRAVARGQEPLSLSRYRSLRTYWEAPRPAAPGPAAPRLTLHVGGGGLQLGWAAPPAGAAGAGP